jgi:hypothetical protein
MAGKLIAALPFVFLGLYLIKRRDKPHPARPCNQCGEVTRLRVKKDFEDNFPRERGKLLTFGNENRIDYFCLFCFKLYLCVNCKGIEPDVNTIYTKFTNDECIICKSGHVAHLLYRNMNLMRLSKNLARIVIKFINPNVLPVGPEGCTGPDGNDEPAAVGQERIIGLDGNDESVGPTGSTESIKHE